MQRSSVSHSSPNVRTHPLPPPPLGSTRCLIMHNLPQAASLLVIVTPLDIIHVRQGGIPLLLSDIRFDSHGEWGIYCPHHLLWIFRHLRRAMEHGRYSESLQWTSCCQQVDGRFSQARGISRARPISFGGPGTGPVECPASPAAERLCIVLARICLFKIEPFVRSSLKRSVVD